MVALKTARSPILHSVTRCRSCYGGDKAFEVVDSRSRTVHPVRCRHSPRSGTEVPVAVDNGFKSSPVLPTEGNGAEPLILTGAYECKHPQDEPHPGITYEATERIHGAAQGALRDDGMEPGEVTEEVKTSMLRGRGGAGFPAGVKWGFLAPVPSQLPRGQRRRV